MPIKKGKNKGKPSNIEKYDTGREQVYTKVLNLQNQINQLAEKEFITREKVTRAEQKFADSLQKKLDSMLKTRNLLGKNIQLRKGELSLLDKEIVALGKIANMQISSSDLAKEYFNCGASDNLE